MPKDNARALFDAAIRDVIADGLKLVTRDPAALAAMLRIAARQKVAEGRRARSVRRGVPVPALMILSVTQRCNLHCVGCYARELHHEAGPELTTAELGDILRQAEELGTSVVLLAGGEPLTRPDLFDLTEARPGMLFVLFTNGTLLDADALERLAHQRHVIPVLSLEGHQVQTDARRGAGIHAQALEVMSRLKERGLFYGISLTVTSQNYDVICTPEYARDLIESGCRLFFFVEYVPTVPGSEFLIVSDEQRAELGGFVERMQSTLPGLFISLPGDESLYGGCLAAGNGFVHVNSTGSLEPCPFAPWSDSSLRDMPLEQALRSPFMAELRSGDLHLSETSGGCALWAQKDRVVAMLENHRTQGN